MLTALVMIVFVVFVIVFILRLDDIAEFMMLVEKKWKTKAVSVESRVSRDVITNELIASFAPCKDRHNNYLKYYKGKSFTIQQFMGLKNISHSDKMWVGVRLLSDKDRPLYAAAVAESVLHIFEAKYPNDDRPRKIIEALRAGVVVVDAIDAHVAAINAAHATYDAAIAAYSAYAAAFCTAYVAHNAAAEEQAKQEKLNRTLLIKYLRDKYGNK